MIVFSPRDDAFIKPISRDTQSLIFLIVLCIFLVGYRFRSILSLLVQRSLCAPRLFRLIQHVKNAVSELPYISPSSWGYQVTSQDIELVPNAEPAVCIDEEQTFLELAPVQIFSRGARDQLLTPDDLKALTPYLPQNCIGKNLELLYTTTLDGYSLSTFCSKVCGGGSTLIMCRDTDNHIFGAFSNTDWLISESTNNSSFVRMSAGEDTRSGHASGSFFGTGESFLFSVSPTFRVYPWTHKNSNFQLLRSDGIGFGSPKFGLWFDSELDYGCSEMSETYGNKVLASKESFKISKVEVWGFTLEAHLPISSPTKAVKMNIMSSKQM